jgi:hypothetical protein
MFSMLISSMASALIFSVTAPFSAPSPMGGNGHNVSFDGRLFIVRTNVGWDARILKPELAQASGLDVSQVFSPPVLVQAAVNNENALAMCEETPQPTKCDGAGNANAGGDHDCYEQWIIDSDAVTQPSSNFIMRRRKLKVVVENPRTGGAFVSAFNWVVGQAVNLQPILRGIEPSVTKDGKLMLWQGRPTNNGLIDTIVYSVNANACAATGWTAPKSITAMNTDPLVTRYRLSERPLRDPAGVAFAPGQIIYGGYPWIFPDGEAVNFTATNMPCRVNPPNEDPPGCGPRRSALSVIGYPTNWQVAHIDGAVNPDTDQTVRLFFTSPGPMLANPLPFTNGLDVWPFFGSNTINYTEFIFDDGLDGQYAGFWHFNEFVNQQGNFDYGRTADSSGYSNTGVVKPGANFPLRNNGALGKALVFDGIGGRVEIPSATSLSPVNAITVELTVRPTTDPNCDANNNYRLLIGKPNIGGAYGMVLEDDRQVLARFQVANGQTYDIRSGQQIPLNQWTKVAFQYDAASGTVVFLVNGIETARVQKTPSLLTSTNTGVFIGAGGVRAACPNGDGAFQGELDEVAISRKWRYGAVPGGGTGGGMAGSGGGVAGSGGGAASSGGGVAGSGGGVAGSGGSGGGVVASGGGVAASGGGAVGSGGGDVATGGGDVASGGGDMAPAGGSASGGSGVGGGSIAMGSGGNAMSADGGVKNTHVEGFACSSGGALHMLMGFTLVLLRRKKRI